MASYTPYVWPSKIVIYEIFNRHVHALIILLGLKLKIT